MKVSRFAALPRLTVVSLLSVFLVACSSSGIPEAEVRPDAPVMDVPDVVKRTGLRGVHRELWYHGVGCHGWLIVTRDTMSHEIKRVEFARDAVLTPARMAEGKR